MEYKKMLEDAKSKGLTSEKTMYQSIDAIDDLLVVMEKEHPKEYWNFMRNQHGLFYNSHYCEKFARWDVEQMKPLGMYWTPQQIEDATKGISFPNGTTLWDKFVAYNAFKNDLNDVLKDEEILKVAYAFWFADKDWHGKGKVWEYMALNYSMDR